MTSKTHKPGPALSELLTLTGLAGGILCLAGLLPGPVGRWGPQAMALFGMSLMAAAPPPGRFAFCQYASMS